MRWLAPLRRVRWIARAAAAGGLALTVSATTTPTMADSELKRLTLRQDLLGFEAVGRLDFDNGFCSGALIAPNLVLTAAHCLVDRQTGEKRDPRQATFRAGFRDGRTIAEAKGARAVMHPDYRLRDPNGLRNLVSDIAILELATPIPAGVADPFALDRLPASGDQVSVVSYAFDRDSAPSYQRRCDVLQQTQGVMEMSCDTNFGSSGAPIFDVRSGNPRIVSIVSRGRNEPGLIRVWGMDAATVVPELRAALRSGRGVWPAPEAASARRLSVGEGTRATSLGGARFVRP